MTDIRNPEPAAHEGDAWRDNPVVDHEYRDFDWRIIIGSGIGLVVFAAIVHLLLWWQFHDYRRDANEAREAARTRDPLAGEDGRRGVEARIDALPSPKLEGLEPIDSPAVLIYNGPVQEKYSPPYRPETWPRGNEQQLRRFAWVDRKQEIVQIPIDDAMRLMLEQGKFKARKEGQR